MTRSKPKKLKVIRFYYDDKTWGTFRAFPPTSSRNLSKRTEILRRMMRMKNVYSPLHDYSDYYVEVVKVSPDREEWFIGS